MANTWHITVEYDNWHLGDATAHAPRPGDGPPAPLKVEIRHATIVDKKRETYERN